jgi:AcrR family transcriptional regulator
VGHRSVAADEPGGQAAPFRRARRPEHKAEREREILAVARALASERSVRAVSLGDIARHVGIAKSNVLRYFETREAIYLRLSAEGYGAWAARAEQAIAVQGSRHIDPESVARLLVETLASDPLFCDLLGDVASTLEHNTSVEAARTHKQAALAALGRLGDALSRARTGLDRTASRELVLATTVLAASLWPAAHPPPSLVQVYRENPLLAEFSVDFVPTLTRQAALVAAALVEEASRPGQRD